MITWSRRYTLVSGTVLILVVNAVALAGVAYNRSGNAESVVHLTERELRPPYNWGYSTENSGVALNLVWQVPVEEVANGIFYWGSDDVPAWLDKAKLASLGFDVSHELVTGKHGYLWQAKEVLLVLELNGSAYQKTLEQIKLNVAQKEAQSTASPDNKNFVQQVDAAKEQLMRESQYNSRLFIVDAGLDIGTLRTQYPDRSQYIIAHGQIRPQFVNRDQKEYLTGRITRLSNMEINVPISFQGTLKPSVRNMGGNQGSAASPFEAVVAFGKRLEPWIMAISE